LDISRVHLTSLGFGKPVAKQSTNSSSGYFFMTDLIQEICWEGKTSSWHVMIVPPWIANKKKLWFIYSGLVLLLKNAEIIFTLKEQKISQSWNLYPT
jgi:hypothetical protein